MLRALLLVLLASGPVQASPWFDGSPEFADDASRELAARVLEAHGGMQPMVNAKSLQFSFFTKALGGPTPFYSFEAVDLENGNAYIEWPFWESRIAWKDGELWSHQWPMPVLRVTFDERSPSIPGTFYDLYVDPETSLMKGIRFDINHPGMVANPSQPIGPNFHVFAEYRQFDGLILPTSYMTYGAGSKNGKAGNAFHFAWDVQLDQPFDNTRLVAPEGAARDAVSMDWWQSMANEQQGTR